MPYYRLYHLNGSSGRIDWADEIEAPDDVRASAIAREKLQGKTAELWQQDRKVRRLEEPAELRAGGSAELFGNVSVASSRAHGSNGVARVEADG